MLPLGLWAFERSRRAAPGRARHLWGALAAGGIVSIPLSGAAPPCAGRRAVRRRPPCPLLAHCLVLGLGRCCWPRRPASGPGGRHRRLVGSKGGRSPKSPPSRRTCSTSSAGGGCTDRAVRVPRLAPAGARDRRPGAVLPSPARSGDRARPGRGDTCRARARDEPAALRDPARRLPAASVPARPWTLPAAGEPGDCGIGGGRGLGDRRAVRRPAARCDRHGVPGPSRGRPARLPLRTSNADPETSRTRALADAGPGRVLELPIMQKGKGHFGSVYQYYTAGSSGAADGLFPRSRRRLQVRGAIQPARLRSLASPETSRSSSAWASRSSSGTAGSIASRRPRAPGTRRRASASRGSGSQRALRPSSSGRRSGRRLAVEEPSRTEPLLCDGWEDGVLELRRARSGSTAGYRRARAGRAVADRSRRVRGRAVARAAPRRRRTTIGPTSRTRGWHAFVVRGEPGLGLLGAAFR